MKWMQGTLRLARSARAGQAILQWPALVLLIAGLALAPQSARAFSIYNKSSATIDVKVYKDSFKTGNFSKTIGGSGDGSCNWKNKSCNPDGGQGSILTVDVHAGSFHCTLPMKAGGYLAFYKFSRPRTGGGYPDAYQCVSAWDYDQKNGAEQHLAVEPPDGFDAPRRYVHFLATADPQYHNDDKTANGISDGVARAMLSRVGRDGLRGIIIAGDLTQNSRTVDEYQYYQNAYSGMRRWIFDGLGNHDLSVATEAQAAACAFAAPACVDRDKIRNDVFNQGRVTPQTSSSNPHYSWDWHDVHFVQLNLMGSDSKTYGELEPYGARTFLANDLARNVGASGRPVVIIQHLVPGWDEEFWPKNDLSFSQTNLWNTVARYNVVAFLVGHQHLFKTDDIRSPMPGYGPRGGTDDERHSWYRIWKRPDLKASERAVYVPGQADGIPVFVIGAACTNIFTEVVIDEDHMRLQRWTVGDGGAASMVDSFAIPVANSSVTEPGNAGTPLLAGKQAVKKCLDIPETEFANGSNGVQAQLWSCRGTANQLWRFDGTNLKLPNGKCLDVSGDDYGARKNGGKIQQWDCNHQPNQNWKQVGQTLRTDNGLCLDLAGPDYDSNKEGGHIQLWECNGQPNQNFAVGSVAPVTPAGSTQFWLTTPSRKCVDVDRGGFDRNDNGAKVQLWDCNWNPSQSWYLRGNSLVLANGKCLDVDGGDYDANKEGARVQAWDCNGHPNQQWHRDGNGHVVSANNKCLMVDPAAWSSGTNGAVFTLRSCPADGTQAWTATPVAGDPMVSWETR